jgi:hypothetical protein
MDEKQKKEQLKRVPIRSLIAAIKKDIRQELKATMSSGKPKKKK